MNKGFIEKLCILGCDAVLFDEWFKTFLRFTVTSSLRDKWPFFLDCLSLKYEGTEIFRNVGNH
jgi:hypothetical protein